PAGIPFSTAEYWRLPGVVQLSLLNAPQLAVLHVASSISNSPHIAVPVFLQRDGAEKLVPNIVAGVCAHVASHEAPGGMSWSTAEYCLRPGAVQVSALNSPQCGGMQLESGTSNSPHIAVPVFRHREGVAKLTPPTVADIR